MKYIKTFEMNEYIPEVGDYVICSYDNDQVSGYSIDEQNFIYDKIGKISLIVNGERFPYYVEYDNIPENIINGVLSNEVKYIQMHRRVIKYFSKDKNELEMVLKANKFNI